MIDPKRPPDPLHEETEAELDERLDEALDETFPASDPVAVHHAETDLSVTLRRGGSPPGAPTRKENSQC